MPAILNMLIPTPISDAQLVSSTVIENDYPVWNSITVYGLGVRCIKGHRIYESQVAADAANKNQGKDPEDLTTQFGTVVYWIDVDPTNRYAMFDGYVNTQTVATTSLTVVVRAGAFNWIYLDGLDAKNIDVTVRDAPGGNVIFTLSGSLRGNRPSTYWQYWFNAFNTVRSKVIGGVPPYGKMELTLTLSAPSGVTVKCGVLAVGMVKKLGRTQQNVEAKPKNYGFVKVDAYGKNSYSPGKKAKDLTATALIDSNEMRQVQELLESAIGVPCMISCSENADYSGLNVFGFVSGKVNYKTKETSEVSITQEGVI
jgi:hypothetical protein